MPIRVLIADDHAIMRDGLRAILEADARVRVVGEASNGREAVERAADLMPDIVVMDVGMPDLNGVEATRRIRAANPKARVIALSAYAQKEFVLSMLEAGAVGYLTKSTASEELLRAIDAVVRDRKYLCAQVAGAVVNGYVHRGAGGAEAAAAAKLSGREREILQLVAEGKSSPQIAAALHLSVKTVETHRRNIMQKLDLHSVADLVRYALRQGISPLDA